MKRLLPAARAAACTLLLALASCGGSGSPAPAAEASGGEFVGGASASDGFLRLPDYHYSDTVGLDGHRYAYTIDRTASDSLPTVIDDEGYTYVDNVYRLTILRDGAPFFSRRFTKASFASHLSADFRRNGLLDGMMCDRTLPGLAFAVSVSLPQSDMIEPLILHVDRSAGIAVERDTRADNDLEE